MLELVYVQHFLHGDGNAMGHSPEHESPVGAMPETAHRKRGNEVEIVAGLTASTSLQRDVNVVLEPSRQGEMPPSPEITYRHGKIGSPEILGQLVS